MSEQRTNVLAIVGFILSFFFALPGLICSILGYKKADSEYGGNCKSLALAGIILSALSIGLTVIIVIAYFAIVAAAVSAVYVAIP